MGHPRVLVQRQIHEILYAQGVLLNPVIFFAKSSIFLLYRQIFTIEKPIKIAIRFGLIFTFTCTGRTLGWSHTSAHHTWARYGVSRSRMGGQPS
ncbi:uncharacterized protein BDW70DRAFT_145166 [Aspergillus foveolatus]|uniref:uncharacterized protein n=1 Tax=Aspergillus foveolatus TaxID=210207 RepID=UPI003CCC9B56